MKQGKKRPGFFFPLFLTALFGTIISLCVCASAASVSARITAPAGWNMLALPVSPDNGSASCATFGPTAFAVDNGLYVNCGSALPPAPGRGFLVYLDSPLDASINGTPAGTSRAFKIKLQQGWNLIGNPFFDQVPLSGLTVEGAPFAQSADITPELYTQGSGPGEYTPAQSMLPYRAYFIFANRAVNLGVSICGASCEPDLPAGADPSLFAPLFNASTPRDQQPGEPPYVSGQAVLAMAPGTTAASASAYIAPTGATLAGANASAGVFLAALPSGVSPQGYITSVTGSPWLVSAGLNYILSPAALPDDPPYLPGAPDQQRWGFDAINMPSVWKEFTPASQPVIAIIDTGVDRDNPELSGRVMPGKNFLDPAAPDSYRDDNGHGTAVSGVAAARGDNANGIAGVCWHCRVMPLKACDASGSCPIFAVLNAVTYAAKNGANIINLSLGASFPAVSSTANAVHAVFSDAAMRGITIVAAAGNANSNAATFLPGADPLAICVGAIAQNGARNLSSNYGPVVDAAAPGENIYTLALNGGYQSLSGTSAAAPFISGLAGLAISLYPGMSPNTLRKAISSTSDPLSTDQPVGPKANALKLFQSLSTNNLPPSIASITPDSPWSLPGLSMRIVAQAYDPENRPLSYDWAADSGTISASGPVAIWTAPLNRGSVTITVKARDTFNSGSNQLSIKIPVLQGGLLGLKIDPANPSLAPGAGTKLTAYAIDQPAQNGQAAPVAVDAAWSINAPIATLAQDGSLAALSQGTAIISAAFALEAATTQLSIQLVPAGGVMNTAADTTPCILDWTQYRCNHSGNSVYSGTGNSPYFTRWSYGMPSFIQSSAISKNGKLYVIDRLGNVAKIDIANGTADWTDAGSPALNIYSTPIILGNYLYMADSRGYILRYDTTVGPSSKSTVFSADAAPNELAWSALEGETQGSTNTIYFGAKRVYAVADNGGASATLLWKFPPGVPFAQNMKSSPILVNISGLPTVVFGGGDGQIYALNASTGNSIWPPVNLASDMSAAPAFSSNYGGRIYIGDYLGNFRAIDAQTGATAWIYPNPASIYSPATVSGTLIYIGDFAGDIRAFRDNGASYDASVWATPTSTGNYLNAAVTLADNELFAIPYSGGTLNVIDPATGNVKWKYSGSNIFDMYGGILALKRHPVQNDMELYIATARGNIYAMEKNYPPQITMFQTSNPVPPAGTPPAATAPPYATIYAKATDPNGASDLSATMSLDLSSIGGGPSELLYDDGTHGDALASDGEYYNNSAAWVPAGYASGPYPLFATASDKSGATASAQYNFLVSEATPSIVSASFAPAYVQKGGVASTTLTVVISDLNNAISSVAIDLDPVNGASGTQWLPLACGAFDTSHQATCSVSGVTANAASTSSPPNALLTIRALDSVNTITAPASLEILGLHHFTATATTPVIAGAASTLTITAYDKYGALYTTYANTNPVTLTASAFSTATTITWGGTGVTNTPGAAAGILAAGRFSNGSATASVADTKAETLTLTATEQDTGTSVSAAASATWTPAALNRIFIRIAPNGGGYEVGSYSMDIGQTLPLWCAGYDTFLNFIADQNCNWNVGGTLAPAPAPGQYSNFNFSPTTAGQSGVVSATATSGASTDATGLIQVSGLMPNSTTLTAANNASGTVSLTWIPVTAYNDTTALDPASVKYEIYRTNTFGGSASDPYVLIFTSASGTTAYTDAAVALYTKYYYVAVTIDSQGRKSRNSNIASVITQPPPFVYKQTCGDQTTGSFSTTSAPGFFNRPAAVAVDASDNMYITDMYNNRIQKFDKDCKFIWARGKFGSATGAFKLPGGIVFNPANGLIYVSDYYNRAQAFDAAGNYQFSITAAGAGSLAVDTTGNIYITTSYGQLLKTTPTGTVLLTINGLISPRGVAVTADGSIYVVENGAGKISKFDPSGNRTSTIIGAYGTAIGKLSSPNGLCADPGGNLYVSDTYNDRIQVFTPGGVLANIIGTSGQNYGMLRRPTGAFINSSGNLAAADNYNNRIQEFKKP